MYPCVMCVICVWALCPLGVYVLVRACVRACACVHNGVLVFPVVRATGECSQRRVARCSGFLNKFLNPKLGLIPYEAHLSFSSGGVARPGVVLTDLQSPIHL